MTTIIPTEKKLHRKYIKEYKKSFRNYLLTSRFNTQTWQENEQYRKTNPKLGCIYCSPDPVSCQIPNESILFIMEMNNDTNKIMGIGMVRNHSFINKYNVYENGNYNRYVYTGKQRIGRDEMTEKEEEIMEVFDILCFKGNRHMKRGQGLKAFPTDMLYRCSKILDLIVFISTMFKNRIQKQ